MKKAVKIVATGRALPEKRLTNNDLCRIIDTTDEWIVSRTGIRERRTVENETVTTLAADAAREAIMRAMEADPDFSKESIGAVFVASSTSDTLFPSIAAMLQKEVGLPESIISYDLSTACSGFVFGICTAHAFMEAEGIKYVLVVASEVVSGIVDYTDRSTCILFGDGAGAAVLKLEDDEKGFVSVRYTSGGGELVSCKANGKMRMNGPEVFKFAVKTIERCINELLEKSGYTLDDIDCVVCHQANKRIIDYVKKRYPDYADKFYSDVDHIGNTSAASIPIALDEMREEGLIKPKMKAICVGFGGGLTYGGVIVNL